MSSSAQDKVVEKLDLLIALAVIAIIEGKNQRDQIELLDRAGITPKDIARLVGTTPNTVSVTLSKLRQGKTLKKSKGGLNE